MSGPVIQVTRHIQFTLAIMVVIPLTVTLIRAGYAYPSYGYGYGYGRPYVGTYWGQSRRVARRVNRRWDRWD